MSEPSQVYFDVLAATKHHHRTRKSYNGRYFLRYLPDVEALIHQYGCKTLLDWGTGKGTQWDTIMPGGLRLEEHLGIEIAKHDPGVPQFAEKPEGKFDIVTCTQVLGAVPVGDLRRWFIADFCDRANKVVYIGEKLAPVRKTLHRPWEKEMAYGWDREQWVSLLKSCKLKGAPVYLRTRDKRTGINILEQVN